jgi:hypothetical protein
MSAARLDEHLVVTVGGKQCRGVGDPAHGTSEDTERPDEQLLGVRGF